MKNIDNIVFNEHGVVRPEYLEILNELPKFSNRQILAWGCGSGKTTKLAVCCAFAIDPILVVLSTNEEVDRLVTLINQINPNQKVVGFHSDNENVLNLAKEDPSYFSKFNILVTNSWRFYNTAKSVLFEVDTCNSLYQKLLLKSSNYRKYVFFDEFPKLYDITTYQTKDVAIGLVEHVFNTDLGYEKVPQILVKSLLTNSIGLELLDKSLNDYEFLRKVLGSNFLNVDKLTLLSYQEKVANGITEYVNNLNSPDYDKKKQKSVITHISTVENVVPSNTNIVILDATADILFETSDVWDIDVRYPSIAKVKEINLLDLESKRNCKKDTSSHILDLLDDIKQLDDYLLKYPNIKHFIVTWKTVRDDIDFVNLIKSNLTATNYSITHYGSGKTRATNEFIDCDSIIFFGDWAMNKSNVDNLNEVSKSQMTTYDLLLAEYVQAVFRTSARLKDPNSEGILIAYTSGLTTSNTIGDLKDRLLDRVLGSYSGFSFLAKQVRLAKRNLTKPTFSKVSKFLEYHNVTEIKDVNEVIEMRLKDLKNLYNTSKRSVSQFDPLVSALRSYFGITLKITKEV